MKKFLLVASLLLIPQIAFGQLATDNFNRADNPSNLGANWAISNGSWNVLSNAAVPTGVGAYNLAYYSSLFFTPDQYSQITVTTWGGYDGPAVRVSAGGNGYFIAIEGAGTGKLVELHKYVATVDTVLYSTTSTFANGDIIQLRIVGTSLSMFRNGTQLGVSQTDSTFATGQPGIFAYQNVGVFDNWAADNISSLASDNFNRADNANLGTNWSTGGGGFSIVSNHAVPAFAVYNYNFWNATAVGPDQYSQVTITTFGSFDGPLVRGSIGNNYYMAAEGAGSGKKVDLHETVASSDNIIYTVTGLTFADGDVLKLQVVGTTLSMYRNGTQIGTNFTNTDIATGQPGIFAYLTTGVFDDWSAGVAGGGGSGCGSPATDDFNRANTNDLHFSDPWNNSVGNFAILSNQSYPYNTAGFNLVWYTGKTFTADQYSEVIFPTANVFYNGPAVRVTTGGNGYFIAVAGPGASQIAELHKYVANVDSVLYTVTGLTVNTNDAFRLRIIGNVMRMYQNGGQIGVDQTDSTFATGQAGMFGYNNGTMSGINDNFVADNVCSGAPPPATSKNLLTLGVN